MPLTLEEQLEEKGYPGRCPKCKVSFVGEEIPEDIRKYYSPPFVWVRAMGVYDMYTDRTTHWSCPDCGYTWER